MGKRIFQASHTHPQSKDLSVSETSCPAREQAVQLLCAGRKETKDGQIPSQPDWKHGRNPMYFDIVPNKTIDMVGAREVHVRTTGAEKRYVTVVLTVMADGKMPPPMVIFKGKRKLNIQHSSGIIIEVQEKTWMDQQLMKVYLNKIWRPFMKEAAENLGLPEG